MACPTRIQRRRASAMVSTPMSCGNPVIFVPRLFPSCATFGVPWRSFLLGLIAGVVLVFVGIGLLLLLARASSKSARRKSRTIRCSKLAPGRRHPGESAPAVAFGQGGEGLTIVGVWQALRNAAADPRIKAILLEPEDLSIGWARLEEMRADLERFRKSGKPVFAYLREPGTRDYYVALAADRIYLGPTRNRSC